MRIAFNIKYRPQIESGEYSVETRDGRPVRIGCWDLVNGEERDIVGVVASNTTGNERVLIYNQNGKLRSDSCNHGTKDLFIKTPEPELSVFEKELYDWLLYANESDADELDEITVKAAAQSLIPLLAKEEISKPSNAADKNNHYYVMKDGHIISDYSTYEEAKVCADSIDGAVAHSDVKSYEESTKRIPTIEEWKWLIKNCKWEWDDKRKGQIITAKNGNSIFLPAAGYRNGTTLLNAGYSGSYWSSSPSTNYPNYAYSLYFGSYTVDWNLSNRNFGRSVRVVSDTQQEGFVDMGNNLFWAIENENGFFSFA